MAEPELKSAGRKRPQPNDARIAERVAKLSCRLPGEPCCQERHDKTPLEVRSLNRGLFALEALRRANVSEKQRGKVRAKVRGK